VIQVLAERGLLKDIDFLSTVSGGGYVGCFLTSRLGRGETHSGVARPHGPDPTPVRYLRQHAKYLSASSLKEQWSMVITTIAGIGIELDGAAVRDLLVGPDRNWPCFLFSFPLGRNAVFSVLLLCWSAF
jgi:hypothetical protein